MRSPPLPAAVPVTKWTGCPGYCWASAGRASPAAAAVSAEVAAINCRLDGFDIAFPDDVTQRLSPIPRRVQAYR